jgi:hypothetical protein
MCYCVSFGTAFFVCNCKGCLTPFNMYVPILFYLTSNRCNALLWLFSMGWAITLAALYAKLHRINQIMESASRFRRVKITAWDAAKPIAILLGGKSSFYWFGPMKGFTVSSRRDTSRHQRKLNASTIDDFLVSLTIRHFFPTL